MKKFKKGDKIFIEAEFNKYTGNDLMLANNYACHKLSEVFTLEEVKEKFGGEEGESFEMYSNAVSEDVIKGFRPDTFVSIRVSAKDDFNKKIIITFPKQKTKLEQVNEIVEMSQEQLDKIMGVIS